MENKELKKEFDKKFCYERPIDDRGDDSDKSETKNNCKCGGIKLPESDF